MYSVRMDILGEDASTIRLQLRINTTGNPFKGITIPADRCQAGVHRRTRVCTRSVKDRKPPVGGFLS